MPGGAAFAPGTLLAAALLTALTSAQGLLTTASQTRQRKYAYDPSSVPLLAECAKFCISYALLARAAARDPASLRATRDWRSVALFAVPSLIYCVHNNLQFYFLTYVDPPTYQILGNLKIVATGLLMRFALGRALTLQQWAALLLLTAGAATSQINTDCTAGAAAPVLHAPIIGYIFGAVSALLSSSAAVYTEWALKRVDDSLLYQNLLLYGWGILFNSANVAARVYKGSTTLTVNPLSLVTGYTFVTWLVVANLSFSGLIISWVMKFADTLVKVNACSLAMVLTAAASVALFGVPFTLQLGLGILVTSLAVGLYYATPQQLATPLGGGGPASPAAAAAYKQVARSGDVEDAQALIEADGGAGADKPLARR